MSLDAMNTSGFALDWSGMFSLFLQILMVLICLTVHETAHGFAAYLLGDPTAKSQHRLSLNPLRHIDPFGALMMLVAGFGWAKPVPVDMRYFKNPKRGMAITALAGPLSNFLLAYVAMLAFVATWGWSSGGSSSLSLTVLDALMSLAMLSIGLGIFNLIPFPPLDGSKILESILPDRIYYTILRYEQVGIIILMAVLWMGYLDAPLYYARQVVIDAMLNGSLWVLNVFF